MEDLREDVAAKVAPERTLSWLLVIRPGGRSAKTTPFWISASWIRVRSEVNMDG